MVNLRKMENFTMLLIFTKCLGVGELILLMIWIGNYRGGFGWQSDPKLQFNWHPVLMSVGMTVLHGDAILVYRALRNTKKYTTKLIHAGLNIFGFIFTIIGLKAVFDSHNYASPPIPNLYSLHSWIGLISVIIFACQWTAGFVIFLFPGLTASLRAFYHPIHKYFGSIGFSLASGAALMGFLEKAIFSVKDYSNFASEGILINFLGVLTIIYSVLILYLASEPSYKRPVSTEDQTLLQTKE